MLSKALVISLIFTFCSTSSYSFWQNPVSTAVNLTSSIGTSMFLKMEDYDAAQCTNYVLSLYPIIGNFSYLFSGQVSPSFGRILSLTVDLAFFAIGTITHCPRFGQVPNQIVYSYDKQIKKENHAGFWVKVLTNTLYGVAEIPYFKDQMIEAYQENNYIKLGKIIGKFSESVLFSKLLVTPEFVKMDPGHLPEFVKYIQYAIDFVSGFGYGIFTERAALLESNYCLLVRYTLFDIRDLVSEFFSHDSFFLRLFRFIKTLAFSGFAYYSKTVTVFQSFYNTGLEVKNNFVNIEKEWVNLLLNSINVGSDLYFQIKDLKDFLENEEFFAFSAKIGHMTAKVLFDKVY